MDSYKTAAQAQFTLFLTEKYKKELLDECRPEAPRVLIKINEQTLATAFGFSDCAEWRRYVIDLDSPIKYNAFSFENALYRHTPRIFKVTTNSGKAIYGIEKFMRNQNATSELRGFFAQAIAFAREQGVILHHEIADDIFFMIDNGQPKVKVKYFSLITNEGNTNE